jgi:hypothetical protein
MIVELRLLIVEVKSWRSGGIDGATSKIKNQKSKFNNHHSSINSSSLNGV